MDLSAAVPGVASCEAWEALAQEEGLKIGMVADPCGWRSFRSQCGAAERQYCAGFTLKVLMKKQIISLLVLISLSFQSTYPAFEGIRKRFGGSIAQARELLNARENIRCLRKGDNCTKERRKLLGTISALVTVLVAAGVVIASKQVFGGRLSPEYKKIWNLMKSAGAPQFFVLADFDNITKGINLNDIQFNGLSLIGAFLQGRMEQAINNPRDITNDIDDFIRVVNELAKRGIRVTDQDLKLANDLVAKWEQNGYQNVIRFYIRVNELYYQR